MNNEQVAELHAAWLKAVDLARKAHEVSIAASAVHDQAAAEERRTRMALSDAEFGPDPHAYPRQELRSR